MREEEIVQKLIEIRNAAENTEAERKAAALIQEIQRTEPKHEGYYKR